MKLYNTLSKKIEEFESIDGEAKLYTCGPTVYHFAHIGNLRNVIFNDTLRRTLELAGYKVNHVMNITDVGHLVSDGDDGDDKLEKGAQREGKTVWEVADFYIEAFDKHSEALNVLKPTKTVRATSAIDSQIKLVETLMSKEFAYQTEQAIYFDVAKLDDYGKLSGQKLADKEVGVRSEVVADKDKKHPQDFALWFFAVGHFKDHQMRWESPWGEGFPGWHLECSAIIHQELGETIDIHTGGVDHIGTHHTNEIAQSEAAYDKPLAKFWLHNEFLHSGGGKMSKSGTETITLDEVIKKGYDPMALRLFYLQSHYRSHADFSWENLAAAQNRLDNYREAAVLLWQPHAKEKTTNRFDNLADIESSMKTDLETPAVLALLSQIFQDILASGIHVDEVEDFNKYLLEIDQILGLGLAATKDINHEQKQIIQNREKAREDKDWARSDELRDELKQKKIGVRDTDQGAIWYRL